MKVGSVNAAALARRRRHGVIALFKTSARQARTIMDVGQPTKPTPQPTGAPVDTRPSIKHAARPYWALIRVHAPSRGA
jgi:hypothetical protein